MEKFIVTKEQAEEIEKQIKINTFLDSCLDKGEVGKFNVSDLLSEEGYEKEKKLSQERELFLSRFSVEQVLEAFLKDTSFTIRPDGNIEIDYNPYDSKLPQGYGFKGGAARSALREALGLKVIPPRDIDVIRLSAEPYVGADIDIAKKHMAQDFEFGDGVEFVESPKEYLETRDFTINEVYVEGSTIVATEECIRDTIRNIVRTTTYEKELYSEGEEIGPKMKAKALRLHAEQMYMMGVSSIPEDDMNEIEQSFINPFWLAVQLDRAFERDTEVAENFTTLLVQNDIIPNDITNSTDLGEYLLNEVYDFRFRNAPHLQYQIEEDNLQDNSEQNNTYLLERYFDAIHYGAKY